MAFANYSSQRPIETTHAFSANYFLILWYCQMDKPNVAAMPRFQVIGHPLKLAVIVA